MVEDNNHNSKALFKVVDKLLHRDQQSPLPACDFPEQLATDFSEFSIRTETIRSSLGKAADSQSTSDDTELVGCSLSHFRPVAEKKVHELLMSSPCKSCELDLFPTWLPKKCALLAVPLPTYLINAPLSEGYVDSSIKTAHVQPLLKKFGLDANILKNYRPVSNLPFASKLLKRVVVARLSEHMDTHKLHESFQSAYKPNHSVESALIRVHSDILQAMDRQRIVVLILLDLSAAFDTIDHRVLLHRLSHDLHGDGCMVLLCVDSSPIWRIGCSLSPSRTRARHHVSFGSACPRAQCWAPSCSLSTRLLWAIPFLRR